MRVQTEDGLYEIILPNATFGIVVQDRTVTEAAPIGKWMKGKSIVVITNWVHDKKGTIKKIVSKSEATLAATTVIAGQDYRDCPTTKDHLKRGIRK